MKRVQTAVPAPADLGTEVIGVPAGASIDLDLRLEAVMEGVLVSGTATLPLTGECARCLDEIHETDTVELRELYFYPDRADEIDDDEETHSLVEDHLDLEPALRDALVLSLPLSPLCAPDCAGLCVSCGARLADVGPEHAHDAPDPRWAALAGLGSGATDTGAPGEEAPDAGLPGGGATGAGAAPLDPTDPTGPAGPAGRGS
jgi:uncharacterized protein